MPRPKGSKNKKTLTAVSAQTADEIDSRIAAMEAEIKELGEKLKARKAELKALAREKAKVDAREFNTRGRGKIAEGRMRPKIFGEILILYL